jgi:cellulose biosynthesis protein BcsQ
VKYVTRKAVKVITFANSKGGVGKTTLLYKCAHHISEKFPDCGVLLIDCSIYGDLTRNCCGNDFGDEFPKFLEDALTDSDEDRFTLESFACKNIGSASPNRPFQLITNRIALTPTNKPNPPELEMEQITKFAADFKGALQTSSQNWIVIIDTDGGEMHSFTKLALCLAETLVVPLECGFSASSDVSRLNGIFDYVENLHKQGYSNARAKMVVFNKLPRPANNTPKQEGDAFTPITDIGKQIIEIKTSFIKDWARVYKHTLGELNNPVTQFALVRTGDAGMRNDDDADAKKSGFDSDILHFADKLIKHIGEF